MDTKFIVYKYSNHTHSFSALLPVFSQPVHPVDFGCFLVGLFVKYVADNKVAAYAEKLDGNEAQRVIAQRFHQLLAYDSPFLRVNGRKQLQVHSVSAEVEYHYHCAYGVCDEKRYHRYYCP